MRSAGGSSPPRPSVVVVDDDVVQRTLIQSALGHAGISCEAAEDGIEGLAKIRDHRPNLAILDVMMPGLDGYSLCDILRKDDQTARMPILMLTGLDDVDSIERAFEAGATNFLTKPVNCLLLSYQVKYVLRNSELERDLGIAKERAEAANLAKSNFLANMGHELRTPLNVIMGFSEIMSAEALGPVGSTKYRDYAGDIYRSATHLLRIINDILDIARLEMGKLELHEGRVRLPDTFEDIAGTVGERAAEAGITVRTRIDPTFPVIWVDKGRLKQVLVNLVINAIKFTPRGGEVTIEARLSARGELAITVIDTGIGIPAAEMEKALSFFGQVDSGLGRKYEGLGLGLPLAKAITELLNGKLTLQSEVGKGTAITLTFPEDCVIHDQAMPA